MSLPLGRCLLKQTFLILLSPHKRFRFDNLICFSMPHLFLKCNRKMHWKWSAKIEDWIILSNQVLLSNGPYKSAYPRNLFVGWIYGWTAWQASPPLLLCFIMSLVCTKKVFFSKTGVAKWKMIKMTKRKYFWKLCDEYKNTWANFLNLAFYQNFIILWSEKFTFNSASFDQCSCVVGALIV